MANVTIDIASQFKGKAAFDKAGKSVSGLEGVVDGLAKKLAGLFALDKIVAFGKASVKAFMDDEKAATQLASAVKNLGLGFANPVIATYISQLSQLSGVADDKLRPAFQTLLQQTQSLTKSQDLLNLAIDVARGSGQDLETVTNDLAQAYVGNTKGLKKYYLGLTQAELKTMSFADVTKRLNDQFKGSSAEYLKTYAGQMERLTTAAGEAKETIGKGLMDALALVAGDSSVQGLADSMQAVADNTSAAIYEFGLLIAQIKKINDATPSWLKKLIALSYKITFPGLDAIKNVIDEGKKAQNAKLENPSVQMFKTDMANMVLNNQKIKDNKKILDATKKNTAELKKQAQTKKQSALFDMEQIQLVAALKGKLSQEDQDRVRLQLALLQGNEELAAKLSARVADSIDKTGELKRWLTTLPDANNPFKGWDTWLMNFKKELASVTSVTPNGGGTGSAIANAGNTQDYSGFAINTDLPGTAGSGAQFGGSTPWARAAANSSVTLQIDGKTIASALLDQSLSGNQAYVDRRTGGFNW